MTYTAPAITELGSVREFTLMLAEPGNKIGRSPDVYSGVTNNAIVGSIVGTS